MKNQPPTLDVAFAIVTDKLNRTKRRAMTPKQWFEEGYDMGIAWAFLYLTTLTADEASQAIDRWRDLPTSDPSEYTPTS